MACLPIWTSVKDEVQFLGYVILSQNIRIEDKKVKAVKNWPESKSVWDIQVFIGFANFYWWYIQGFSRIAAPLSSMLKTTRSSNLAPKKLGADEVVGNGEADDKNLSKKSKNIKSGIQTGIRATGEPTFLTPGIKEAFN